jgi:hypothetical protein
MPESLSTEEKTAFAKAWEAWKAEHEAYLAISTLTPGPYLENRLFTAFADGWNASTTECLSIMKIKV